MHYSRRLLMIVTSSITIVAVALVLIVTFSPEKEPSEGEIPFPPTDTYEHHTASVRFVVSNYRMTDVQLEIKVDGSTRYSGTVPSYGTISDTTLVFWVDHESSTDHSHEMTISAFYDGQDHAQTFTIEPQGPYEMPMTLELTLT